MGELVPTLDRAGVDLLSRMLVYTPQHRITARQALQVGGARCAVIECGVQFLLNVADA